MARLIAKSALMGLLPVTVGGISLTEVETGPVTSIAPFKGQSRAVSAVLKERVGLRFPPVNRAVAAGDVRLIWAGKGRALMLGAKPEGLEGLAAMTDQTGANAVLRIEGEAVEDVLARLIPMDLRSTVFKTGHTARTMLAHMQVSVTRVGADAFEIMAMRSMAGTLVHDLEQAAKGVMARRALG
ncbi:sarcosine oxidase subunit gamma [Flavimaricola marinus]|uniref:Sarcosine oxidase, gamma subunit family n=1 Tax=Flavimaricola marinus TaxID=1819565 RepID=A0A238LGP0_9RHOB|nr:sarcosine oxidase subunit gamma family protein [Flavimaricola marinus]SMY08575.1 Sarcosine oxidase, gamma subunit family [Flavimaricola marinus]